MTTIFFREVLRMKKVLSIVLTLAMVFSLIPMGTVGLTASAAIQNGFGYTVYSGVATVKEIDSAMSGDITIPSTLGGYPVKAIGSKAFSGASNITSITIPDSVTSIGTYAFYNCTGLKSITIPKGVTRIDYYTFSGCTSLENISIPDSVTKIDAYAFYGCTALKDITIPNSVTIIGDYAFKDCTALDDIIISNNTTVIYQYAFYNTGYYNNSDNWENNVLYIGKHLIVANNKILGEYIVRDGTLSIAQRAFTDCEGLTSVFIPDSVIYMGDYIFYGCNALEKIRVPFLGKDINDRYNGIRYLFGGDRNDPDMGEWDGGSGDSCSDSYTNSVKVPDSLQEVVVASASRINEYGFYGCLGLTSITLPANLTYIASDAFNRCTNLTDVYYEGSESDRNNITFGSYNTCLENATWHYNYVDDVKKYFSYSVFNGKATITSVAPTINGDINIPSTLGGYTVTAIGDNAFIWCEDISSIVIPDSITSIGEGAFSCCTGLTNITIPDRVTSIGERAFSWCENLTSITIPNGVTSIGESMFYCCSKLTSVTLPNSVKSIGRSAFEGCGSLISIAIPDGVTTISEYAFFDCQSLTSITIPDSITSIGNYAFMDTGYYLDDNNWENDLLYVGKHLIKANYSISGECAIKDGTLTIADYCFAFREELTGIALPDSVKNIGECAFGGCAALEIITVADGNTVFHSDGNCIIDTADKTLVAGCKNSRIPTDGSVTSIGDYAFYGNYEITDITIPAEVTSIGWCAFAECGGLTDVTILGSMIKIGEGAFEECVSIDKVCYRGSKDDKANIIFGDGNDYLLNATWYYNACTDGHTYSNYYDSLCNKCSWSRGDREPNALNLLEMQQNILGVTDFAYGHFDINFDKIVDSVDISIVQIFILGL